MNCLPGKIYWQSDLGVSALFSNVILMQHFTKAIVIDKEFSGEPEQ